MAPREQGNTNTERVTMGLLKTWTEAYSFSDLRVREAPCHVCTVAAVDTVAVAVSIPFASRC